MNGDRTFELKGSKTLKISKFYEIIIIFTEIPPNIDAIKSMSDEDLDKFKDGRGFNLLMVAAEAGLLDVVNFLIDRGSNVDHAVEEHTAGSLAFANRHHSVVLALLNEKFTVSVKL